MADVVESFLGPSGKWQLRSTLIIFLVKIPSSWFMACVSQTILLTHSKLKIPLAAHLHSEESNTR